MFMSILRAVFFGVAMIVARSAHADGVPADCSQLIVGVAPDWNSMRGKLQLFDRSRGGSWTAVTPPVPVLFGKNGIACCIFKAEDGIRDGTVTGVQTCALPI